MNDQFTPHLRSKRQTTILLVAIIGSALVFFSGCGIPGLRCAQSAPSMPQYFSLNNGAMSWRQQAELEMPAKEANDNKKEDEELIPPSDTSSTNANSRVRVVSLEEPADQTDALKRAQPADANASGGNKQSNGSTSYGPSELSTLPPVDGASVDANLSNSAQLPRDVFFDDPFLRGLISQSLSGNQELRILAEEINITNNEVYAKSGEYRPFVTFGAGAGLDKSSRFTRNGAVEDQLTAAPGRAFPEPLPDFLAATRVSWEIDIWKKLRNSQNAAAMRYLGTQEGRNYVVTRLVAEVAENYYELLALDNRLLTLEKTIEIQVQSLKVAQAKKEAGRATELAVQRFLAEVRKNESERTIIQQEIVEVENRINFLAGRYPQTVERISADFIDLNLNRMSSGFPAELLRNRADIRQAEREVAAAGLDIQVARARFYPSLNLEAGIGLNAYNLRYIFATPEALIYNAALGLVGPLINKRAIQADYRSANAAQLQSIYNYQRTVLTAHIEVVNHLTKVENYRQSIEVKKQQLAALEASVDAATKLFENARAEYVEVLLAQREMMEARMILIEMKQEQLRAMVNAYQALGGGGF